MKNNPLQNLIELEHLQAFTPYQKSIEEYENIDHLLTKSRFHANSKIRNIHMKRIHLSRKVKLYQLRVRLYDLLIKRKETDTRSK